MAEITTVGLDLAKSWFQVHGADAQGRPRLRKKLARGKLLAFFAGLPRCLIGMEACGSAHYWARELIKLGHEVRLIPPQYVKPYVKGNKHDAADARRPGGGADHEGTTGISGRLDRPPAAATTGQRGGGGASQQDGADRLGRAGQGGGLSAPGDCSRVKAVAARLRPARASNDVMA